MKIGDIRDPNLFQRLVHKLYIAERGHEFQVVNDAGGDRGNDGYDVGRSLLLSIYCPERPETADYRAKATSDLGKAAALAALPEYGVEGWLFVTPTPLRDPLQAELRASASALGLAAGFIAEHHLEDLYRRHVHLHDDFPELEYPKVGKALADLQALLTSDRSPPGGPEGGPDGVPPPGEGMTATLGVLHGFIAPQLGELRKRLNGGDQSVLHEVERFRIEATDRRDELAALLVALEFENERLNLGRVTELATEGLRVAKAATTMAETAVFGAHLAYSLVFPLVSDDIETLYQVEFGNRVGFPILDAGKLAAATRDLEARKARVEELLAEAVEWANRSEDLVAQYIVAMRLGQVSTQLYFPHHMGSQLKMGNTQAAKEFYLIRMTRAHGAAVQRAKLIGKSQLGTAYHNFANDLLVFGEIDRAEAHSRYSLSLAEEANDEFQREKALQLLAKIARDRATFQDE